MAWLCFSVACICFCLSYLFMLLLLKALTEKFHFWYAGTSSECLGQVFYQGRSSGQGQGHEHKGMSVCLFVGDLPSFERQSCRYCSLF